MMWVYADEPPLAVAPCDVNGSPGWVMATNSEMRHGRIVHTQDEANEVVSEMDTLTFAGTREELVAWLELTIAAVKDAPDQELLDARRAEARR